MTNLSRRTVLVGTAALTLTAATAALSTGPVWAQVEGVSRQKVGSFEVVALLDGRIPLAPGVFSGASDEEIAKLIEGEAINGYINAFVVTGPDGSVLVDAGAGALTGPTAGNLASLLASANVDASTITHFYATHLHPDHIGGLVGDNAIALPNAQMVVHENERAFWTSDDNMNGAGEGAAPFFQAARGALAAFGDRVTAFTGEDVPGPLSATELFGHTPGHVGYRVADGDAQMLIWGDIIHAPVLQFPRPEITIAFDVDPAAAEATRKRVLDMVATDTIPVAGMHLEFPAIGTVTKSGDGYAFNTNA